MCMYSTVVFVLPVLPRHINKKKREVEPPTYQNTVLPTVLPTVLL